jgi:hypothetical protein
MHRGLVCSVTVLLGATSLLFAQAAPDAWTLTYSVSGGIEGTSRRVTITSGGRLQLDDGRIGRLDVPALGDISIRARDFVAAARDAERGPVRPLAPDQVALVLASDGRTSYVEATPEIVNAIMRATDVAVWQSLVGTWRQSGGSACSPPAQLGPADLDPAIEALALNGDGTFSIRWPGGARSASLPNIAVPHHRGRFRASLTGGGIEFTLDDGADPPRDFSGNGTFAFDGGRLLLRGIWFGTRAAAQKPDVCEIEFVRT